MRTVALILALCFPVFVFACANDVAGGAAPATFDTGPGPFFPEPSMIQKPSSDLTGGGKAEGKLVVLKGRVTDLAGSPHANTFVILWQADRNGYYYQHILQMLPPQPDFGYLGIARTNEKGEFTFYTLRPPPYGPRSAHIHLATLKSDNTFLFTEVHFADDRTPERAIDLTSADARELVKTGTPGKVQFEGSEPRDVEIIEFNIRVP